MGKPKPAEVFPPGDSLKEELEERGWSQADFSEITGIPSATVSDVLGGKRPISPDAASRIGAALGTGAEVWLNLDAAYRLAKLREDSSDVVSRRARLYALAPVKEMVRRGWIERSDNIDVLESRVCRFLGIDSPDDEPEVPLHAAKKSTSYEAQTTPTQRAWLIRAAQLAHANSVGAFSIARLDEALAKLRLLLHEPREARHVPRILNDAGIRFVIVQPLTGSKIDGATFWIDKNPTIAMSLRFDRLDNFWFVLLHELGHVRRGEEAIDVDLLTEPESRLDPSEESANAFAANFLVPGAQLESFIARIRPLFSARRIEAFARTQAVHPAIVVGQLQHRGEIAYQSFRKVLVPVRDWVTAAAVTDGWGCELPAEL